MIEREAAIKIYNEALGAKGAKARLRGLLTNYKHSAEIAWPKNSQAIHDALTQPPKCTVTACTTCSSRRQKAFSLQISRAATPR